MKNHNNRDWLYDQYVISKNSIRKISMSTEVSGTTIRQRLIKFNIPLREAYEARALAQTKMGKFDSRDWLLEEYIINKRTIDDLSFECKVDRYVIKNRLKRFDIKERDLSEVFRMRGETLSRTRSEKISKGLLNPSKGFKSGSWINNSMKCSESYDSSYEFKFMIMMNSRNIKYTKKHGIIIPYHFENKNRHYVPDYLVDNKYLIEIKPECRVKESMNQAKFKAAEKYCRENSLDFQIYTEKELFPSGE